MYNMNLLLWVCLVLATWRDAFGMYYTRKKELFQPPVYRHLRNNSYFGYSITYDESDKKLVISSPRENDIGEVYNCNIENKACLPIFKILPRVSKKYNHDYWFGATVKAGRDFVMMCAPRHTENRLGKFRAEGICFSYANGSLTKEATINEAERFKDAETETMVQLTMDTFGWSIDVASDNSIMVGGPGMFHGRAMIYKNISDKNPTFIKKSIHTPEFNFGYAVASGLFINESLSYAVGSPYGTVGFGEVAFYNGLDFVQNLNNPLKGSDLGSMFGAVLCSATLYGNRTDLLVGAPTYATKTTHNLGAVYVYLALTINSIPVFKRKIVGQVSGSMFGSAIVNVGDLNGDEKHEIAIGAPFEKDGHGVVYLYSGADLISKLTEMDLKFLQRIEPAASYGESFGMSLTALLDYDENGCKELAIGSPYKDTVVLLRCMASVFVETSANFPNLQGRAISNKTDFEFEVCLSVKYPILPKEVIARVSTTVEIDHEYAKLIHTNNTRRFTYETSLDEKKPQYCKNVSFRLPLEGRYETKINYIISSKLLDDPGTLPNFNSSRVTLSDRSDLDVQYSLWAAECADSGNKTCVPNLNLTTNISFYRHDDDPYIIGSSITENLTISVYNDGEVAYESCVRVNIVGANVLTTPTGCEHEDSVDGNNLMCEPPKPIRTKNTWITGDIVLEMTHLTNLDRNIIINTFLFVRCEDGFTQNISKTVPLKADSSGINAKGETDIGSVVNMTREDIEKNGKKMQHIYMITNKGLSNWKQLPIQVTLQMQPYVKYKRDTPVTVYDSTLDLYSPCSPLLQNDTSMSYVCKLERLMTNLDIAKIYIPMDIVPGVIDDFMDKDKNATIMSSIKIQFTDDDYKVESITTTITLQEATIPMDIIIIAVIVGICIIIIIAVILYRVGFLRRKKKEELEKLKIRVKRQTILRNSMRKSNSSARGDGIPVLGKQLEVEHDVTEDCK